MSTVSPSPGTKASPAVFAVFCGGNISEGFRLSAKILASYLRWPTKTANISLFWRLFLAEKGNAQRCNPSGAPT